jgi:Rha family phage regulatory protein
MTGLLTTDWYKNFRRKFMNEVVNDIMMRKETPMVSSRIVADRFHKEHKNVLRDIENLDIPEDFNRLNFEPVKYTDQKGESRKAYNMTRDGFMLLVMGFTGKEAMDLKIKYINGFNYLAGLALTKAQNEVNEQWKTARITGKSIRTYETEIIQRFIAYAEEHGSENAKRYYANITKMEYSALGIIELLDNKPQFRRDVLNVIQLGNLWTAAKALQAGMDKKMFYKDIYLLAKQEVVKFAELIGAMNIGDTPLQTLGVDKPPEQIE